MLKAAVRFLLLLLLVPAACLAQTVRSDEHAFRVVKLVEGLDHPWSLAFHPTGGCWSRGSRESLRTCG